MKVFKKRDSSGILPLSSNPNLNQRHIPGIDAYFADLSAAFKNPRIRNIAITGQHGVGKSSIIKSFDAARRSTFRRKPKFLYVSLGEYCTTDTTVEIEEISGDKHSYTGTLSDGTHEYKIRLDDSQKLSARKENGSKNKQDVSEEQNAIERRLLLQLCSKFEDRYFPASGFRLIPKQPGIPATFCFVFYSMALMLLAMKKPLAELVLNWNPQGEAIEKLCKFILRWHECGEAVLYAVAIIGTAVVFWKGFKWLCIRGKKSNFAVKTANAEWDLGENTYEDYLDQYTQELVYCLSRVGKKIDYTVVFEDMDRLDGEISIPIFIRLREINHLVNTHMDGDRCIRFVFVVKDSVALSLNYDKFFDFTLPIVPTLNKKSSAVIFLDYLNKVNNELEETIKKEHLQEKIGIFGAWIVVYLDSHPVLKEICCVGRKAVRWISEIINEVCCILFELIKITFNFVKLILTLPKKMLIAWVGFDFWPQIKKKPVLWRLFSWAESLKNTVLSFCHKLKALMYYQEKASDCENCNRLEVGFNDNRCIHRMEGEDCELVRMAATFFMDYRKMFTMLNEYSLMVRLYLKTNPTRMTCDTTKQILAFQIYKHLFTDDYRRLIEEKNEPNYLTTRPIDKETGDRKELLKELQNYLSLNSLDFAGFSRTKIAEIWKQRLENGDAHKVIDAMHRQKGYLNPDLVKLVQEYCRVSKAENDDVIDIVEDNVLEKAIIFIISAAFSSDPYNKWFFNMRDSNKCIKILAKLEESNMRNFIELSQHGEERNVYEHCVPTEGRLVQFDSWEESEAKAYALGVPKSARGDMYTTLKNGEKYIFE